MNGKTRLSEALAASPDILEYIISLSPHDFDRLRTPLLRKVMPPRITLGRVAAMVGIPEQELVAKVNEIAGLPNDATPNDSHQSTIELPKSSSDPPTWFASVDEAKIEWVDVTPIDAEFGDPMPPINIAVNTSKQGDVIGIKHKWEPQPLFDIWHARGLQFWSKKINADLWHIFVYKPKSGD